MRKIILATILAWSAAHLKAADPYIGYIYPSILQVGTTNRVLIGGQGLPPVRSLYVGGSGVQVLNIQHVPNFPNPSAPQRRHLVNWLNGIAAGRPEEPPLPPDPHLDEWRSNSWWTVLNTLDAYQLSLVEQDLFTKRNALQASPSLRQMMLVTVVVAADAPEGRREVIACGGNGMSAPRPLFVSSLPQICEPRYVPPVRRQPDRPQVRLNGQTVVLHGQIQPGTTDTFRLHLNGGTPYAFQVTARELQPYIGDAVPGFFNAVLTVRDASGNVLAKADDDSRFLPDPHLLFTPPANGFYSLEIHDLLYRGRADFVYAITAGPSHVRPALTGSLPHIVPGPGLSATQIVHIAESGSYTLEVTARREGSPLDPVLTLRSLRDGSLLAQWDDTTNTVFCGTIPQSECDPIGRYEFSQPGDYLAEITDRTGHGGPDYAWRLDVRRAEPSFDVRSTRSTLPLRRGKPLPVTFRIERKNGFDGDIRLEFPAGMLPSTSLLTSGVSQVTIDLSWNGRPEPTIGEVRLFAHAESAGKSLRVPVIPCDEYEQAFAWKHLVPARTFWLQTPAGDGNRNWRRPGAWKGRPGKNPNRRNKQQPGGQKRKKMIQ